jgi:hypothetical protein
MAERTVHVRAEALSLYQRQSGLSEQELARRAYPERSLGAARQHVRHLKGLGPKAGKTGTTPVPESEARRLAEALDLASPSWLQSWVVWMAVESVEPLLPISPGGAVVTWDRREDAEWASELAVKGSAKWLAQSPPYVAPGGLYPRAEVVSMAAAQFGEVLLHSEHPPWRWYNEFLGGGFTSAMREEWSLLLFVERYLRGEAHLRDAIVWGLSGLVVDHLVPLFAAMEASPRREAIGDLIARWLEIERDPEVRERVKREQGHQTTTGASPGARLTPRRT